MDEVTLIQAARQGDLEAFNQLVLKYQDLVYNLAYRILHDPYLAEELSQETFLLAYRSLLKFKGGSFRSWLMRIATNASLDEIRRHKRRIHTSLTPIQEDGEECDMQEGLADPGPMVEEIVERSETRAEIQAYLGELTPEYRSVLVLVDLLDFDYAEAAETIGVPMGTVKSRLARARLRLRDMLQSTASTSQTVGIPV